MFASRVYPFSPPPGLWFIEAAAIVITRKVVDLLTAVLLQHSELADDLFALRVFRSILLPRHISQIQCDIPIETGCGFGLSKRFGQALPPLLLVSAHVSIGEHPNSEHLRRFSASRRGFGGILSQ